MEAEYDWLFWIDISEIKTVLCVSNNPKKSLYLNNIGIKINYVSIDNLQAVKSLKKEEYDLVFVQSLNTSSLAEQRKVLNSLKFLVRPDALIVIGFVQNTILSSMFAKFILKLDFRAISKGFLNYRLNSEIIDEHLKVIDKLNVFPSISSPWTISNSNIIIKELQWWKKTNSTKMKMIYRIMAHKYVLNYVESLWPSKLVVYRKSR